MVLWSVVFQICSCVFSSVIQVDAGADRFPWQSVVSEMVINFPHKQIVQALAFSAERDRSAMKVTPYLYSCRDYASAHQNVCVVL
jgi:hypothetical protein